MVKDLSMNRAFKLALMGGLVLTTAACASLRERIPFGLGGAPAPTATATEGQRISVLEFEQALSPSPALAGRDFFLPGPQAVTSWSQPGRSPENLVEHVIAAPNFTVAWRRNIGAGSSRTSRPMAPVVADNGRVFAMDGVSTVTAVSADSGDVVWRANVRGDQRGGGFGGGLALGGGKVFVSSGFRTMTALDAATGAVVWSHTVEAPIHGAPTVVGSRVYVIDVDNQILAFDVASGRQVWAYRGITEPARVMRASSVAVTGETVIAPFSSGELVALSAASGQPLWNQTLSRTSRTSALSEIRDIAGRPVVSRGMAYAVGHSGVLASVDIRTGRPVWQASIGGVNAPLPVGDVVYVVSKTGTLVLLNRENGQVYWTRDLNEGRVRQEGGFMGAFDRTVRPDWSGPILASNRLVLVNSDGQAVAYDPKTGLQTASIELGGPAYIAPSAYNGALYVLTDKGDLVSIR